MSYKDKITNRFLRELVEWVEVIVIALVIALIVKTFILETTQVSGISMEQTLYEDQKLFINKFIYKMREPKRGEIIVFLPENVDKNYIKRVIALPGEVVEITPDGRVLVDDVELVENYINTPTLAYARPEDLVRYPLTVPEDEYFVMGDNRRYSEDSRFTVIGCVPKEDIRGKAFLRIWPLKDIGIFKLPNYDNSNIIE